MEPLPDTVRPLLESLRPAPGDPATDAFDAVDQLVLDIAAADLQPDDVGVPRSDGRISVIDDTTGALTLGAVSLGVVHAHVHQDSITWERALACNADRLGLTDSYTQTGPLASMEAPESVGGTSGGRELYGPELLEGARVVLLRLPKSLDALAEIAEAVARHASPDVVLYAGGRVKHMSHGMNDVLGASFGDVHASLGRHKSRVLVARSPLTVPEAPTFPRAAHLGDPDLTVVAHGGVFAGTRLDIGTRYLLGFLPRMAPDARDVIDVGCGSGVLATAIARARPEARVLASDRSAAAVASARATALANGVGHAVRTVRDDALSSVPDASADLLVCNPPFHSGTAVDTEDAQRMFDAAGRVLRPGGELWTVYNSHLTYRRILSRSVGPTEMMGQNPKFTVTRSVRKGSPG
jgi:16S rRNA (guanine1207-N2)-methyltransferase